MGLKKDEIDKRVESALQAVDLLGYDDKSPFFLGRAERQKIAVASTLAMEPKLMIIDEPTTGMDWLSGQKMMNLLSRLHENGHTIIFITHDMNIVGQYAKRVIVLEEGRIVFDGNTDELVRQFGIIEKAGIELPQISQLFLAVNSPQIPLSVDDAVRILEV
jgi:energy-coupling factor transport system ATP-binding protein